MGRPARPIPPGTVYPAGVIVRESAGDDRGRDGVSPRGGASCLTSSAMHHTRTVGERRVPHTP